MVRTSACPVGRPELADQNAMSGMRLRVTRCRATCECQAKAVANATALAGTWRKAEEVPGLASLNSRDAQVNSVSCGSPGHCAAGGLYSDTPYTFQAFVVNQSQHGGTLGKAHAVLVRGSISSVSCPAPGNCGAGGSYTDSAGHGQAFVVLRSTSGKTGWPHGSRRRTWAGLLGRPISAGQ
jgi:hypothetical protein